MSKKNIFTIPASLSFSDTLAATLIKEYEGKKNELANALILLPTRRACRVIREAFLRQTEGKPLLLPQLKAIGDVDEEELILHQNADTAFDIPPAMSPLRRKILLTKLISSLPDFSKTLEQNMALAQALGTLMDQVHTENLNLSDLPHLVDKEAFADHWQITIDFLEILSIHWPEILEVEGCIDAADRRNRLILALNTHWQNNPPTRPVIAAGTTGSIYATKSLLKTIMSLSQGEIVLPGLDLYMSEEKWADIEEGHPQATLKNLLESLEIERKDVQPYTDTPPNIREKIISDMMLPAEWTSEWGQNPDISAKQLRGDLQDIKRYDCENIQQEAALISVLLRETLEENGKTAALITPDRNLARRVAKACEKWDIVLDDSAGQKLSETSLGIYLLSIIEALNDGLKPYSLLSVLKNTYSKNKEYKDFRKSVRLFEKYLRRNKTKISGFDEYKTNIDDDMLSPFITNLEKIFSKSLPLFQDGFHGCDDFLKHHLMLAEAISSEEQLWQSEAGEAAAQFFSDLKTYASSFPSMTGADYLAVINHLMTQVTIRPKYGTHPRLHILGQLEARLIQADRVILAGLNEGAWPPALGHDPWMSRPMRKDFGLPPAERSLTLAAHDFVQGICHREVFLTRSKKLDGTPTLPARWLERLDTYIKANDLPETLLMDGTHLNYVEQLHAVKEITPIERPAPCPPVSARPRQLSVTRIETWMKDPYAIYAGKILGLYKLEPLEKEPDAAEKGNILHSILHQFVTAYPKDLPDDSLSAFLNIAQDELASTVEQHEMIAFYFPRLIRLGEWFIDYETTWREKAQYVTSEAKGQIEINDNFTLEGRADRIDRLNDGSMAIIDYKSGGTYSKTQMEKGGLPQLPLEALILNEGGFSFGGQTSTLAYWKLTGSNPAGDITEISDIHKITDIVENTKAGLINLIEKFDEERTPYYAIPVLDNAPRYNDYAYLERVKEWAALEEESEAAA